MAGLNGTTLRGRALRVKEARQREERREPRRPRWEGHQAGQSEDTPASVLPPTARLRSLADARGGSLAKTRMVRLTYNGLSEVIQEAETGVAQRLVQVRHTDISAW